MMMKYYCVLKAPFAKVEGVDYMVIGGIYVNLDHARERVIKEKEEGKAVWIEKHGTPKGWLDVVSKETLLEVE